MARRLQVFAGSEGAMTIARRRFMHLGSASLAASVVPRWASAGEYPDHPIKLLVGNAAGGGLDVVARLIAHSLGERLGTPVVVDNRPGAGTNIATDAVVRAPPDGYTLLMAATPNAINASLYHDLRFNFMRDIAPIASVAQSPLVMVVAPSFPAKTVSEFIAYAKANPGKVSYASAGVGTPLHIAGEMFKIASGVEMTHVPYKGVAAGLTDLLGGSVQTMFADMTALEQIKVGALRALAVTTTTYAPRLPDTPPLSDVLPGYEAATWLGVGAPRNTPKAIIDTLHDAVNASLAEPRLTKILSEIGFSPLVGSSAAFQEFIAKNTETWAHVIKTADIHAE